MAINWAEVELRQVMEIDPTIEAIFKKLTRDMAKDCENRPHDKTTRKVKMSFELTPVIDKSTGELDYIAFETVGNGMIPKYRTRVVQLRTDRGKLLFNLDAPDRLDQTTLDYDGADDT